MAITPGARIGSFEIIAPLGSGGGVRQRYTFETSTIANYDISLDGSRFLMVKDELAPVA
jgi:hypothetical protein